MAFPPSSRLVSLVHNASWDPSSSPLSNLLRNAPQTSEVTFSGDLTRGRSADATRAVLASEEGFLEAPAPGRTTLQVALPAAPADEVIVGVRVFIGASGAARAPRELTLRGRTVRLPRAERRWVDVPLTAAEATAAGRSIALAFGPAHDSSASVRVDSVEIYTKPRSALSGGGGADAEGSAAQTAQAAPPRWWRAALPGPSAGSEQAAAGLDSVAADACRAYAAALAACGVANGAPPERLLAVAVPPLVSDDGEPLLWRPSLRTRRAASWGLRRAAGPQAAAPQQAEAAAQLCAATAALRAALTALGAPAAGEAAEEADSPADAPLRVLPPSSARSALLALESFSDAAAALAAADRPQPEAQQGAAAADAALQEALDCVVAAAPLLATAVNGAATASDVASAGARGLFSAVVASFCAAPPGAAAAAAEAGRRAADAAVGALLAAPEACDARAAWSSAFARQVRSAIRSGDARALPAVDAVLASAARAVAREADAPAAAAREGGGDAAQQQDQHASPPALALERVTRLAKRRPQAASAQAAAPLLQAAETLAAALAAAPGALAPPSALRISAFLSRAIASLLARRRLDPAQAARAPALLCALLQALRNLAPLSPSHELPAGLRAPAAAAAPQRPGSASAAAAAAALIGFQALLRPPRQNRGGGGRSAASSSSSAARLATDPLADFAEAALKLAVAHFRAANSGGGGAPAPAPSAEVSASDVSVSLAPAAGQDPLTRELHASRRLLSAISASAAASAAPRYARRALQALLGGRSAAQAAADGAVLLQSASAGLRAFPAVFPGWVPGNPDPDAPAAAPAAAAASLQTLSPHAACGELIRRLEAASALADERPASWAILVGSAGAAAAEDNSESSCAASALLGGLLEVALAAHGDSRTLPAAKAAARLLALAAAGAESGADCFAPSQRIPLLLFFNSQWLILC